MRRLVILALVALPGAAVAAPVADRDDTAGAVDLRSARAAHNRVTDELVHVIDLYEPLRPDLLLNRDGPPGSVCVNVWTTRTPGEAPPNYDVCVTADSRGRELRASITRHGARGAVRRAGPAKVEQPRDTRLELRFDPDRIRRPDSFRWTVQATTFSAGCPVTTGCEDFVPDRPRTSRTELRAPRRDTR